MYIHIYIYILVHIHIYISHNYGDQIAMMTILRMLCELFFKGGTCGLIIIVSGNGNGKQNSNLGQSYLIPW